MFDRYNQKLFYTKYHIYFIQNHQNHNNNDDKYQNTEKNKSCGYLLFDKEETSSTKHKTSDVGET
jgi:hypothetical protein